MPGDYDKASDPYGSFGAYLRSQRQLAQLTLRQLAELSSISNPYLSQIERGLHQPSVAVIRSIAEALNLSADALLAQVAGIDETEASGSQLTTESAIRADARLTSVQKSALLSVYRSMIGQADLVERSEDETVGETPDTGNAGDAASAPPARTGAPPPGTAARRSSRRSGSSPAAPTKRAASKRRPASGRKPFHPGPDGDPADPSE